LKEADDSDLSDSDDDEEVSHFQVDNQFQFAQVDSNFKPQIAKLFKQSHDGQKFDTKVKLDLR
jgi:hypothetical protein